MKYKHWDEYTDAERWEVSKEVVLEINNGTTKEDLNNIINFLVQIADPYTTEDLVDEVKKPVTWQEAFQAWIDGCYIRCEGGGRVSKFKNGSLLLDNLECPPSKWMMKNGKWYVED